MKSQKVVLGLALLISPSANLFSVLVYLNYLCSVWLLNSKSLSLILGFIGGIPIHSDFFPFLDSLPVDVLLQCCFEVCDFESIPLDIIFVTLDIILQTDKSSQSI